MAVASNTLQNYETLGYRAPNLSIHSAAARQIISPAATYQLSAKEAGALCVYDIASGFVFTLPPISAFQSTVGSTTYTQTGAFFDFIVTTTITSNAAKVITSLSTEFLLGAVWLGNSGATTGQAFAANGSTIRALSSNGTTTGGIIGDAYRVTLLNTTQWFVQGLLIQTGVAATPFATS